MSDLTRTTVTARREDLATLQAEAARRRTSLTAVVAEALAEKAASLRAARLPRVGVARSTDGLSAAQVAAEPVARDPS